MTPRGRGPVSRAHNGPPRSYADAILPSATARRRNSRPAGGGRLAPPRFVPFAFVSHPARVLQASLFRWFETWPLGRLHGGRVPLTDQADIR